MPRIRGRFVWLTRDVALEIMRITMDASYGTSLSELARIVGMKPHSLQKKLSTAADDGRARISERDAKKLAEWFPEVEGLKKLKQAGLHAKTRRSLRR